MNEIFQVVYRETPSGAPELLTCYSSLEDARLAALALVYGGQAAESWVVRVDKDGDCQVVFRVDD